MKIKRLLAAYALFYGVSKYRQNKKNNPSNKNEKCENYYRCDDLENDGRGDY
ncbi:MAG TPA: hypothetical protein PLL98_11580 [Bacillota bacterium]|nr:hypothetical protein [Bacillota bacterium]HPL53510.1 hypothetical protein [Bacillota bacterium]